MVERSKCMNVPEIRFKEFDEEWSENLLEDFFTKVTSKNRKLKYSAVLTNSAEYGIIGQLDYFDFDVTNSNNIGGYFIVEPDDFVYNPRVSVSAPVGPINRNRLGYTGIMSPLYLVFKINGINKDFLCYYYKTKKWHRFMKLSGNCGARFDRLSISDDKFVKMPIIHPNNTKEQNQICKVFENLDDLIEESTLRLVSLKRIKAASLQSMFPQEGETVPKVRFKGFEGEWNLKYVFELLCERNELSPQSSEFPLMAFIANNGIAEKGERYDRSALVNDVINKQYKRTYYGDFIYSSNNLGTGSIGLNTYGKATISPVYSIFYCTLNSDSNFVGYCMTRKSFIKEMIKWRQGVMYGQWRIHENDFLRIKVLVPSLPEQQQIGTYFRNLDQQISLQTKRLEKLKQIKAACLDKMFV